MKMRQNGYKVFLDIDDGEPYGIENSLKAKYGVDELI